MRDAETTMIDVAASTPDVRTMPPPPPPPSEMGTRYEFRLARDTEGWAATVPYYLRDRWWRIQPCLNVRSSTSDPAGSRMESVGDGWYRCELVSPLSPFVGTFFSPSHPDSGDRGHGRSVIGRNGVRRAWGRVAHHGSPQPTHRGSGSVSPCVDGSQDRHRLPCLEGVRRPLRQEPSRPCSSSRGPSFSCFVLSTLFNYWRCML